MIAFGVESGGKGEDFGGAELHTESATLTPLNVYSDEAFCHKGDVEQFRSVFKHAVGQDEVSVRGYAKTPAEATSGGAPNF
jgi:hypothetical protein